ncbi:PREDICTED: LOW QUALITY PROTEIN: uncharacterized protein LOC104810457 [Tarenaya hassleriana]|uniref:LOW QUALITY PROTEIN: uncharacterized protein LOC104810457 n=1 Tax=Tarenaya hassleriana TaxID=28532 RepID=UPI00053C6C16|nr:PREDICTED: LOW QUALITY PROTEIN: uncharacterized protein LOC104810457 [Tarenaya hassleriana]
MDLKMNSSTAEQDLAEGQVEAIDDLLEECWFFDNMLNRRSRVLRYCHSDPFPSSSSSSSSASSKPKPIQKTINSASDKCLEASTGRVLIRAPSLPLDREGRGEAAKRIGKLTRQLSEKFRVQDPRPGSSYLLKKQPSVQDKGREGSRRNRDSRSVWSSSQTGGSLQRTQTLPSYIGRDEAEEEFQDQESDARLGFLIREALASSAELTPPSQNLSKVSAIPRHRPMEECIQEPITGRDQSYYKTLRKTVSNLETEEIQRLGMGSNRTDSDSESKQKDQEERMTTKGKSSAGGRGRCAAAAASGPPIPARVPKDSRRDMKAQIKFWARAVASNVRQEC